MSNLPFRREQIISMATNLAREIGLYNVTATKVTNLCKCSRATLYYHFEDMSDLREEIIRLAIEKGYKKILRDVEEMNDPVRTIIPRGMK